MAGQPRSRARRTPESRAARESRQKWDDVRVLAKALDKAQPGAGDQLLDAATAALTGVLTRATGSAGRQMAAGSAPIH